MNNTQARLQPGNTAPDFSLQDSEGHTASLADRKGRSVVVYFYPKAATPGCTTEACDFRDNLSALQGAGYDVLGISPDGGEDLRAFAAAENLTFPLLSDPDAAVARAYGSYGEKEINGKKLTGVLRSTIVVGPDGTVTQSEYNIQPQGHVRELRASLGI
ncbi:thioredoxin-dependent thiol peroxidase [Paeniglutamicibacter cryotolerans]|uniref:thioredoxin-dependent peroxiredoxin n=1 Tax=Paeniglutamicibacter cryotolerans TaxID=670079 RepID=A0A839QFV5_9MICC|nr:thioredoxin-dependent thiol peroxidase [Paeniglutamicibacter cryotolerans]MBB2994547.1 peroxiredoxin Q/BCP [Paeniglutamicibacter cryotolerans]